MRQELQLFFKTSAGLVAHHCTHLCEKIPSRLRVVSHPFSAAPPARRRAQLGAAAHRPSERDLSVLCPMLVKAGGLGSYDPQIIKPAADMRGADQMNYDDVKPTTKTADA